MTSSVNILLLFYILFFSFIIFIISLFLIRVKVIKNIEKRYKIKLDYPFFLKSSFTKCTDVGDYIFYLYLIKLNIRKFREPLIILPLLYIIEYELKGESKSNIIICIIYYFSNKITIFLFILIGFLLGIDQEMYLLFNKLSEYTNKYLFYTCIGFLLVNLILTLVIKFKIFKEIETKYNVKLEDNYNYLLFKYFDVSNYIKDLFLNEKKYFDSK
jgi:hypothetical protein